MKQCPTCKRMYPDDSLTFCLDDGARLAAPFDPKATQTLPSADITDVPTELLPGPPALTPPGQPSPTPWKNYLIIAVMAITAGGGMVWLLTSGNNRNANSNTNSVANRSTPESSNSPTNAAAPSGNTSGRNGNVTANSNVASNTNANGPAAPENDKHWFVFVGTFPKRERAAAEQRLYEAKAAGYNPNVIDTDEYPALNDGYWAVVLGQFYEGEAKRVATRAKADFPDAYAKSGW